MEAEFEVIVVGAGLSGCAAAYSLAKHGVKVLLIERGRHPGSKSMSGGLMYCHALHKLIPEFWNEAPVERYVKRHVISLLSKQSAASLSFDGSRFSTPPYNSYTVLLSKFNEWFGSKVEQAGGIVADGTYVGDLLWDGDKVVGVKTGGEEIRSRVVIAADGVNSRLVESAKVRGKFSPSAVALGVKSVVGLPSEVIQGRFNVHGDEGVAYTFLGCTGGMQGGGFLYTNRESVSVGVVAGIHSLIKTDAKSTELLDELITHPTVSGLIEGATPLEYSAQLIPEGGLGAVPQLHRGGFLVVGDAAGFASNSGLLLRGMDFAVASGAMAAEVVTKAKEKGDYSDSTLSQYEGILQKTFVIRDLRTYRNAPRFLSNQRLYSTYPDLVCNLMERLYAVDGNPRQNLFGVVRREMKGKVSWVRLVEDLLGARAL
ncbi:MAG TPA: FAD-dependent oxidoreductase [Nitrososphaerales archaeon]|nr:FAD-dependent oxidoreductase [Nitrososphaerales archaeon]